MLTLNPFLRPPEPVDPPGPESALANYSSELYLSGDTERALDAAQEALKIARTVQTLLNMSIILECLGRFDESFPYALEAYQTRPDDRRTAGHYGRALLRKGDFPNGWPLYLQDCNLRSQLKDFIPEWDGRQDLHSKRVLVVEGEGYGDNLYFMRWLGTLRRLGATVEYVCQPSLAPLVDHCGYLAIENWGGNVDIKFHEYDYHASILTLPHKLGVTLENYQWDGPYIRVFRTSWEPVLRVGICSLAGEGMSMLRQRSMHASQLQQLLNSLDPRHKWVNLHHHYILPESVDHPKVENWLDTAKAIASCDMIVTVDTAVAHLSGAMGVPTWVILPGASAWHYLSNRPDLPLYPTMRLFRNYGRGLENALEACCDHLSRL